jgi:cytidine deaminase
MTASDIDFLSLKSAAERACALAYAPYSHFPVGASVADASGKIVSACNVENASFGLTMCAERSALAAAVAAGLIHPTVVVIYTPGSEAHAPCGACRQVIHELMNPGATIISCCDSEDTKNWSVEAILPDPFVTKKRLGG